MTDLTHPAAIMQKLTEIEHDLEVRQNALEAVAMSWFAAKRNKEKARAVAFLAAEGTVAERQALADRETATDGVQDEALYESLRAVVRTLEARANIGMAILKSQGRVS